MSRTRTLTQLLGDVRFQADVVGFTVRHPDADLTRLINQSIQQFREEVSSTGLTHFLTSATGTLTTGVTTGFPYKELDCSAFSPNVVRIFLVQVKTTDNIWVPLRGVDFSEVTNYQSRLNSAGRIPESFANLGTDKIAILPAPGYTMSYRVWYLPVLADLANGSDTFNGVAGWEQWVVWDVCAKVCARDQNPQSYALITAERDRCWQYVLRASGKVNAAGGVMVRRDTLGRADVARRRLWF